MILQLSVKHKWKQDMIYIQIQMDKYLVLLIQILLIFKIQILVLIINIFQNHKLLLFIGYSPTSLSGTTIGKGFDVGQFSVRQVENMFNADDDIDNGLIAKLTPLANLQTQKAITDAGFTLEWSDEERNYIIMNEDGTQALNINATESARIDAVLFQKQWNALTSDEDDTIDITPGETVGLTEGNLGQILQLRHWVGSLGGTPYKLAPLGTNYLWDAISDNEFTTLELYTAISSTHADEATTSTTSATHNRLEATKETLRQLVITEGGEDPCPECDD